MSWQRRLIELALAGGFSAGACSTTETNGPPVDTCNANPDPCCSDPDGGDCASETDCNAQPNAACCAHWAAHGTVPACDSLDAGADGGDDAGQVSVNACNSASDPCCGEPDAGECGAKNDCIADPTPTCCTMWQEYISACWSLDAGADEGGDASAVNSGPSDGGVEGGSTDGG